MATYDPVDLECLTVALYWHCWNLPSQALDALTRALRAGAAGAQV